MNAQEPIAFRGRLSASVFPEAARLNAWKEQFGRQFLNLDIDPLDDTPFHHDIDFLGLPELSVSKGRVSAVRYSLTPDLIKSAEDNVTLLIPETGSIDLDQQGKEAHINQGDALIRRTCETGDTYSTRGDHLALMVSREALARYVGNTEQFAFAAIRSDDATLGLLKQYLRMLMSNAPTQLNDGLSKDAAEMISRHVHEVFGLLLSASRDLWEHSSEHGGGLFALRLSAIREDIQKHARNPDYSIYHLSRVIGVTPGYIRKILATEGQRFSDLVRSTRLDAAHRLLSTPQMNGLTITEIAFNSGFNDLSYFNRCFKQRFGMTPGEARDAGSLT